MDGTEPAALRRCVVVGAGAVGGLVADVLAATAEVVVVDLRSEARAGALVADARRPGPELRVELERADAVVLALPRTATGTALDSVGPLLRPDALLVDTTSVKSGIVPALRAVPRCEALSINPMFRPERGMRGRPIAVVPVRGGPRATALLAVLTRAGARLIELSAAEHDAFTAGAQVATHAAVLAFGRALRQLGTDVELLRTHGPPPARALLALLARVVSGEPEVYWDVQAGNPAASRARRELVEALHLLDSAADDADPAVFADVFAELSGHLGEHREALARRCADMFAAGEPATGE